MADYWEEQQLKQMGMMSHMEVSETKPDPKFGEPALEKTLENVKKTLWDVEHHTSQTQSRLDKNNQSGPSHPLYKIAKWTKETEVLDIITETLVEIQDTLENSAIARHSASPLETSIDSFKESSVSFNEKTLRWHDDLTNLMVKGSDPRVAEAIKSKPSALEEAIDGGMETEKKTGLGVLAGFLKEISIDTKAILEKTSQTINMTAEDEMETAAWQENRDRDMKKRGKTLTGIWDSMKENAKGGWLAKNWKLILAGLFILFAPLKWFKPLWEMVKVAWNFTKDHPILAGLLALGVYLAGPLNLLRLAFTGMKTLWTKFMGSKMWASIAGKVSTVAKGAWAATKGVASKAVGAVSKIGMKGAMGGAALLAGVALAIKDGIAGAKLSKEWGTSKAGGVAGAVLGGTDKGISGAFKNAGKWALIGAGIGSFVPVIGTLIGGVVGAGVGAIAGFFGGAAIGGWIDSIASTIKEWFFSVIGFFKESLMQTWEGIKDIWENGLSWERVWNLVKANPLFRLGDIIAEGLGNLWKSIKSKFSWIPGFGPDEAEAEGEPPKTDAEKLEADKQKQRDIISEQEKEIAGGDTRTWRGQNRQGLIDEARGKLTKLGVDDRTHRENKAELAAVKSGKMTKDEYIVSERGQADRKDVDTGENIGMNKEEQLQLYEEYAGTREPEDYAPAKPIGLKGILNTLKKKASGLIADREASQVVALVKDKVTAYDKHMAKGSRTKRMGWGVKQRMSAAIKKAPPHLREAMIQELKGTKLGAQMKKSFGDDFIKTDLREVKGAEGMATITGGVDMMSDDFGKWSSRQSPSKQSETMNRVHEERAALGNQAPPPTIISSNSTQTSVQSNPLTWLSGSPSARGKEVPVAR